MGRFGRIIMVSSLNLSPLVLTLFWKTDAAGASSLPDQARQAAAPDAGAPTGPKGSSALERTEKLVAMTNGQEGQAASAGSPGQRTVRMFRGQPLTANNNPPGQQLNINNEVSTPEQSAQAEVESIQNRLRSLDSEIRAANNYNRLAADENFMNSMTEFERDIFLKTQETANKLVERWSNVFTEHYRADGPVVIKDAQGYMEKGRFNAVYVGEGFIVNFGSSGVSSTSIGSIDEVVDVPSSVVI
jgi:hypothetical protein